jgi:copper chaperone
VGGDRGLLTGWRPGVVTMVGVTPIVINVVGMTCEHCAKAVRTEISGLPGVTDVDVDVSAGMVTVLADPVPDDAALKAAIDAAGYELAR